MFPTTGYFQNVLCPALNDGKCDRPYCHFGHFQDESTTEHIGKKLSSSKTTHDPVYKPTPICILEKRSESHPEDGFDYPDKHTCARPLIVSDIPIYQPTPISDLEKYAPSSLSSYKFDHKNCDYSVLPKQPSYSPVNKSSTTLSSSVLIYHPSQVHGSMSQVSASKNEEAIELNIESDDDTTSDGVLDVKSDSPPQSVQGNLVSEVPLLDPTQTNADPVGNSMCLLHKDKQNCKAETQNDLAEDSSLSNSKPRKRAIENNERLTLSKRQKILSLYEDLYGPINKEHSSKNSISASKIIPYHGIMLKRPQLANSDKSSDENGSMKSEDADVVTSSKCDVQRPRVPLRKSNKIPMPIRTRYLDQFIEECLLIYELPADAYKRALTDEQACHDKATTRMAYLNAVIHCLKYLKSEKTSIQLGKTNKIGTSTSLLPSSPSSSACGNAKSTSKSNYTDFSDMQVKDIEEQQLDRLVRGPLLYDQLKPYILTMEQLTLHGFPTDLIENDTIVHGKACLVCPEFRRQAYGARQENERVCCRCGAVFKVDEFGFAIPKQTCVYHWGKSVKQRVPGRGYDIRYLCCQGEVGQSGCHICSEGHVHDANRWLDNEGFVATLPPLPKSKLSANDNDASDTSNNHSNNVYALDCEMVYTTGGCELGRITIVDSNLNAVLDQFVRPENSIIDTNVRFSGLKYEDLEQATDHLTDVQRKLLHLFDSDTILVGHSLESDLISLKLIHKKIVDTSVLFPHRLGLPKKRALRNIVSDLLNELIQQDDTGHNSMEDACACMKLVQHKIKENLRRGKWSLN